NRYIFQYKCYSDGTLGLYFKSSTVNCTRKDEPVRFNVSDITTRLTGEILCPNIRRFCKVHMCMGNSEKCFIEIRLKLLLIQFQIERNTKVFLDFET
ncbi:unnamed protein product, partial [Schistosoma turkestanicum]